MSLTGGSKFILTGGATNYQIARSLRFRSGSSAYLSRAQTGGNRQKFTWSVWFKLGNKIGSIPPQCFFDVTDSATSSGRIAISSDTASADIISYYDNLDSAVVKTSGVYRDTGAWTHLLVSVDRTISNGVKIYINGSQVTTTGTQPSSGTSGTVNTNGYTMAVGRSTNSGYYFDGYMAGAHFVDGSALTPSTFGQLDAATNAWVPILVTGVTYGTNGFYLPFSDNSAATSTTIGKDGAGSNNLTPTNISVTAGVTNDSLVDVPTNYGSDTGVGGEVRGNCATINPLDAHASLTISDGNLKWKGTVNATNHRALVTMPASVPIYWEWFSNANGTNNIFSGLRKTSDGGKQTDNPGTASTEWAYGDAGSIKNNNTTLATWTAIANGEYGCAAYNPTTGNLWFGRISGTTRTWYNSGDPAAGTNPTYTLTTGIDYSIFVYSYTTNNNEGSLNCGQRAYIVAAPTGATNFKALCTQNLPNPAIAKPSLYMDVNTRTGTGAAFSVTGKLFQPDIIWTKSRSAAKSHAITDSQFGTGKYWSSDGAAAYVSDAQAVTAFNSDGFSGGTAAIINTSAESLVDWLFKKSVTAGIDLVKFSGNSTNRTIAHSLGVAPSMLIVKRDGANGATIWHTGIGSAANYLALFSTAASAADAAAFNSTAPTSSVFSVGTNNNTNATGTNNMLAMLFAEVAGFSKFGSYTGNGSTDGPFVWCGFRPRFIMFKKISATDDWEIIDTARNSFNGNDNGLFPSWSGAEQTSRGGDVLSNGIKLRYANGTTNESGQTHIFAAFAESPFKTARAR